MFQKTVADGVTFSLKHRALVHRTLLNAIAEVMMRMFWNTYTENLKKNEKEMTCLMIIAETKKAFSAF